MTNYGCLLVISGDDFITHTAFLSLPMTSSTISIGSNRSFSISTFFLLHPTYSCSYQHCFSALKAQKRPLEALRPKPSNGWEPKETLPEDWMPSLGPIMLSVLNLPTGWEPKETLPEGWKLKSNLRVMSDGDWRLTLIDIDGQGSRPITIGLT